MIGFYNFHSLASKLLASTVTSSSFNIAKKKKKDIANTIVVHIRHFFLRLLKSRHGKIDLEQESIRKNKKKMAHLCKE